MFVSRTSSRIEGRAAPAVGGREERETAARVALAVFRLSALLACVYLIAAVCSSSCLAATTVTVTPSSWTFGDPDAVVTMQANTAASGNNLAFDIHADVDGDGVIDPEDIRIMSLEIADGEQPHLGNEFYWHDEDGELNSSVTATLTAYGYWEDSLFAGDFVVKVTDEDSSSDTAAFSVTQNTAYPCVITGTVQKEGTAVPGAIVLVLDWAADLDVAMGIAEADGSFELRVQSPGAYGIYAVGIGSVSKLEEGSGQLLSVSSGSNPLPQPLVVFPGNRTISGRVFADDSGEGMPGLLVIGEAEEFISVTFTNDEGDYSLAAVDGDWGIISVDQGQVTRLGYVQAAYRAVTVSGSNVEGIGLMCKKATTLISGTVKDGETQETLEGVSLFAEEPRNGDGESIEVYSYSLGGGVYKIGVVEGDWWVGIDQDRLLGTGYAPPPGQLVTAPASGTVAPIDFVLHQAGSIAGYVYEDDGVTPIEEAWVEAWEYGTWNWVGGMDTRADGSYTLSVPSGSYTVMVYEADGFVPQYYSGALVAEEATAVVVTAPGETSGINFTLDRAAFIKGYVYEEDGFTPIVGAWPAAIDQVTGDWLGGPATGDDGSYSIPLPTGSYKIWVAADGWVGEYYDNTHRVEDATVISVIVPEERSGVDFVLAKTTATIKGHVYKSDGITPIVGASVTAFDNVTEDPIMWATTGTDGAYTLPLPPGTFRLMGYAFHWDIEYYDEKRSFAEATPLTLSNFTVLEDIDFNLDWVRVNLFRIRMNTTSPGCIDLEWLWIPGMRYFVFWKEDLNDASEPWNEVPDPSSDIVQEGQNGGNMIWTDRGTSPGMDSKPPSDPDVRHRFYRVMEEPE